MAFLDRGPRSVIDPGRHGLAAESRVRPFPAASRVAWAVFVLLFGLPAYVGFLLYRRWPIRLALSELPCSGSPRPCGLRGVRNTLPGSGLKGIEIFA